MSEEAVVPEVKLDDAPDIQTVTTPLTTVDTQLQYKIPKYMTSCYPFVLNDDNYANHQNGGCYEGSVDSGVASVPTFSPTDPSLGMQQQSHIAFHPNAQQPQVYNGTPIMMQSPNTAYYGYPQVAYANYQPYVPQSSSGSAMSVHAPPYYPQSHMPLANAPPPMMNPPPPMLMRNNYVNYIPTAAAGSLSASPTDRGYSHQALNHQRGLLPVPPPYMWIPPQNMRSGSKRSAQRKAAAETSQSVALSTGSSKSRRKNRNAKSKPLETVDSARREQPHRASTDLPLTGGHVRMVSVGTENDVLRSAVPGSAMTCHPASLDDRRLTTTVSLRPRTLAVMNAAAQTDADDELKFVTLKEQPNSLFSSKTTTTASSPSATGGKRYGRSRTAQHHRSHEVTTTTTESEENSDSGYSSPLNRRLQQQMLQQAAAAQQQQQSLSTSNASSCGASTNNDSAATSLQSPDSTTGRATTSPTLGDSSSSTTQPNSNQLDTTNAQAALTSLPAEAPLTAAAPPVPNLNLRSPKCDPLTRAYLDNKGERQKCATSSTLADFMPALSREKSPTKRSKPALPPKSTAPDSRRKGASKSRDPTDSSLGAGLGAGLGNGVVGEAGDSLNASFSGLVYGAGLGGWPTPVGATFAPQVPMTQPGCFFYGELDSQQTGPRYSDMVKKVPTASHLSSGRRKNATRIADRAAHDELTEIDLEQQVLKLQESQQNQQAVAASAPSPAQPPSSSVKKHKSYKPQQLTRAPLKLDFSSMVSALQHKDEAPPTEPDPVVRKAGPPVAAAATLINPLDSSGVTVKLGKVKSKKRHSPLKKVILSEREERKLRRRSATDEAGSDAAAGPPTIAEEGLDSTNADDELDAGNAGFVSAADDDDDEADVVLVDAKPSSSPRSLASRTTGGRSSPVSQAPSHDDSRCMSPTPSDPNSGKLPNAQPACLDGSAVLGGGGSCLVGSAPSEIAAKIHSRRFREYCNQVLNKDIDAACTALLQDLVRFQERAAAKSAVKAKQRRRIVLGLREVTKHLRNRKLKCVIVSPNLEKIQSKGGLDDSLSTILDLCAEQETPVVFALGRRALGRALGKLVPVSCVGLFNYQGSEANYKSLIELTTAARAAYADMVASLEREPPPPSVHHRPSAAAAAAAEQLHQTSYASVGAGHSRTASACSALSFLSHASAMSSEAALSDDSSPVTCPTAQRVAGGGGAAKHSPPLPTDLNEIDEGHEADAEGDDEVRADDEEVDDASTPESGRYKTPGSMQAAGSDSSCEDNDDDDDDDDDDNYGISDDESVAPGARPATGRCGEYLDYFDVGVVLLTREPEYDGVGSVTGMGSLSSLRDDDDDNDDTIVAVAQRKPTLNVSDVFFHSELDETEARFLAAAGGGGGGGGGSSGSDRRRDDSDEDGFAECSVATVIEQTTR